MAGATLSRPPPQDTSSEDANTSAVLREFADFFDLWATSGAAPALWQLPDATFLQHYIDDNIAELKPAMAACTLATTIELGLRDNKIYVDKVEDGRVLCEKIEKDPKEAIPWANMFRVLADMMQAETKDEAMKTLEKAE